MCDEFICSDSGVGLCEDDRKLLESLGSSRKQQKCDKAKTSVGGDDCDNNEHVTDNNNNEEEANRNIDKDKGGPIIYS